MKKALVILLVFVILLILLFSMRMLSPTEIDDVTPGIDCPEIEIYNPDILYIIPNYYNNPISQNEGWCDYILSLNKTLALHGITHTYREFLYLNISQEDLDYGISEFEKCFGFKPEIFKSPQLATSSKNRQLIKQNNLKFRTLFDQITHKVYHCDDSDKIPNKIIRLF
ncbi:MAG: DUF2334 domain-containing protein [Candidatus Diapherotrites archaeon]